MIMELIQYPIAAIGCTWLGYLLLVELPKCADR